MTQLSEQNAPDAKEIAIADLLEHIRTDREAGERFIKYYPDLHPDLIAYRADPNCKCAGDMRQALVRNPDLLIQHASDIMGEPVILHTPRFVGGSVATAQNEDDYSKLIARCRRFGWHYQGLTVVPAQTKNGPVLRIFFY